MSLNNAELGMEYIISEVAADDEEIRSFLFTLGCYSGEPVTVVARKKGTMVLSLKESRYSIDDSLAEVIKI